MTSLLIGLAAVASLLMASVFIVVLFVYYLGDDWTWPLPSSCVVYLWIAVTLFGFLAFYLKRYSILLSLVGGA